MLRYAMFYYDTKRSVEENLKVYQKYLEGFLRMLSTTAESVEHITDDNGRRTMNKVYKHF